MRSFILLSLLILGVGGCTMGLPKITPGMSLQEVDKRCSNTFPVTWPVGISILPDGTFRRLYKQEFSEARSYIVVDDRDGVVTQVQYIGR